MRNTLLFVLPWCLLAWNAQAAEQSQRPPVPDSSIIDEIRHLKAGLAENAESLKKVQEENSKSLEKLKEENSKSFKKLKEENFEAKKLLEENSKALKKLKEENALAKKSLGGALQELNDFKNPKITQECGEFRTPWQSAGHTVFSLQYHQISCGIGNVLYSFQLETYGASDDDERIRYVYKCCKIQSTYLALAKCTDMNDDGKGNVVYLDRHTLDCPSGFLSYFKLERNYPTDTKIQYKYNCIQIPTEWVSSMTCYNATTPVNPDTNVLYLNRHLVECKRGYAIQKFRLIRDCHPYPTKCDQLHYRYTCCKME